MKDLKKYQAWLQDMILDNGHAVQMVMPAAGERGSTFAYTVGRTMKARPELIIAGPFPPQLMKRLLNDAVALDDQNPIQDGVPINGLIDGLPMMPLLIEHPREAELFGAFTTFGEESVTAIQLAWPDANGRWPWEDGVKMSESTQPIFKEGL